MLDTRKTIVRWRPPQLADDDPRIAKLASVLCSTGITDLAAPNLKIDISACKTEAQAVESLRRHFAREEPLVICRDTSDFHTSYY